MKEMIHYLKMNWFQQKRYLLSILYHFLYRTVNYHTNLVYAVRTTKILVTGQAYKVMNAIFRYDICIKKDYYMNICGKEKSNTWIEISDAQVTKNNDLKVLKTFMYFFSKNCY